MLRFGFDNYLCKSLLQLLVQLNCTMLQFCMDVIVWCSGRGNANACSYGWRFYYRNSVFTVTCHTLLEKSGWKVGQAGKVCISCESYTVHSTFLAWKIIFFPYLVFLIHLFNGIMCPLCFWYWKYLTHILQLHILPVLLVLHYVCVMCMCI